MKYYLIITLLGVSKAMLSQKCLCGEYGFGSNKGDSPEFVFTFSDSTKIGFCGHNEKMESDSSFFISEFNVFTCDSSKNILGYSAIHYCNVFFKNDTIFITRIKFFPIGENNEWISLPFSQRIISKDINKLDISEEKTILDIGKINNLDTAKILSGNFMKMNYNDISNYLGQLTLLAIKENKKAVNILFSEKLNNSCDAAVGEHLIDCKEVYNWFVKGHKNRRYWR